jgi:hypothetical protein
VDAGPPFAVEDTEDGPDVVGAEGGDVDVDVDEPECVVGDRKAPEPRVGEPENPTATATPRRTRTRSEAAHDAPINALSRALLRRRWTARDRERRSAIRADSHPIAVQR